jgi:hypothetical protein
MAKIQTTCPRCRQPILVEVQQLFDMNTDPTAKQKLLSGTTNVAHCPNCGYEGMIGSPIVYHDPAKELLLTFFPPEMGVPLNEQERQIGPLLKQVVNALPNEKRKGYLFQPQTMLTFQTMIDRILEADGITREMVEAQQKRVELIQKLLTTPAVEDRIALIKEQESLIDGNFFAILSTLIESTIAQGDEKGTQALAAMQKELLENTSVGRELLAQNQETREAIKTLQEASKNGLTREKLLDIIVDAKSESTLATLVTLARSGLDYQFFQILSERIDNTSGEEKQSLVNLRDRLLSLTREIDEELQKRLQAGSELLEEILKSDKIEETVQQRLPELDDYFTQAIQVEFEKAHKAGDLARIEKIQKVISTLEKASAPPPEVDLIQKLIDCKDESSRTKLLEENSNLVNDEFLNAFNSIIVEGESRNQAPELLYALREAYKSALRFSMMKNLKS